METLATVLAAGNHADGKPIVADAGVDVSGSQILLSPTNAIADDGAGTVSIGGTVLTIRQGKINVLGGQINMSDTGFGIDMGGANIPNAGSVSVADISIRTAQTNGPADPLTVVNWLFLEINGAWYSIPLYQ